MGSANTDRHRNRFELYNTLVLAIAALAVAWCSYQGTLWNGIQTFKLAESNYYFRLAQQKIIQSGQSMAMEEAVIISFINAVLDRDQGRIDYIIKGVRPEMGTILSNWLESRKTASAAAHPMAMPEYDSLMKKRTEESQRMSELGDVAFKEAQKINLISDKYSLAGVMFSMVMFLGAITTKLTRLQPRVILTVTSAIICIGMMILVLFYLPVAHKG